MYNINFHLLFEICFIVIKILTKYSVNFSKLHRQDLFNTVFANLPQSKQLFSTTLQAGNSLKSLPSFQISL